MIKKVFLICSIVCCFYSCRHQSDSVPILSGKEYYPTDSGRFCIYTVHEINYNGDITDTSYHRKDVIHDVFVYQNVTIYEVYQFYKPISSLDWPIQPDSVSTFTTDQNKITVKENNIEFIRLLFPLSNGKTWDGNARNQSLKDDYTLTDYNKPYSIGLVSFPETATVVEEKTMNLVLKDYRTRIYAKNVGLIYKKYEQVAYNTSPGNIGLQKIDFGKIVEETLINYGTP